MTYRTYRTYTAYAYVSYRFRPVTDAKESSEGSSDGSKDWIVDVVAPSADRWKDGANFGGGARNDGLVTHVDVRERITLENLDRIS
jgi:hypothetical protein